MFEADDGQYDAVQSEEEDDDKEHEEDQSQLN